jgi:molybdenum cofactor guanylyltransferase
LQQLILEYQPPVTCFINECETSEPLAGIWNPDSLDILKENVSKGGTGLNEVVAQMNGKLVRPLRGIWIKRADTKQEWEEAIQLPS